MSLYSYFKKSTGREKREDLDTQPILSKLSQSEPRKAAIPSQRLKPSDSYAFPKKVFSRKLRSCQSNWFDQYHWLHYDEASNSVFYFFCMKQDNLGNLKTAKNRQDIFIKTGFTNWKKATHKFSEHQKSKNHELALTFEITIPNVEMCWK